MKNKLAFILIAFMVITIIACSDDITNDCKICGIWYTEENANDLSNGYFENLKYQGMTEGQNLKFEFENNNHFQLLSKCKIYLMRYSHNIALKKSKKTQLMKK